MFLQTLSCLSMTSMPLTTSSTKIDLNARHDLQRQEQESIQTRLLMCSGAKVRFIILDVVICWSHEKEGTARGAFLTLST